MKKIKLTILYTLLFGFLGCTVYKYPEDITNSQYQGNVKSVVSTDYNFDKTTNKKIEKKDRFKYVVEYDRQGRKISSWSYKNDMKSWGSNTTFSKDGTKVETVFKNESKTVKHAYLLTFNDHKKLAESKVENGGKVVHTYNKAGKRISKTSYTEDGKCLDSTHYHFDSNNNNIKMEFFDKKGKSAYHYTYDENGFKNQAYRINKKGKLADFNRYKNDQFGNRTDHFSYIVKGKDTILKSQGKNFYTYDKYNNVIKDSAVYNNGDYISITHNTFTYWD